MKQYHINKAGKKCLCSGYGVYPSGENCTGCLDCKCNLLKKLATNKQVNKNCILVGIAKKKKK